MDKDTRDGIVAIWCGFGYVLLAALVFLINGTEEAFGVGPQFSGSQWWVIWGWLVLLTYLPLLMWWYLKRDKE